MARKKTNPDSLAAGALAAFHKAADDMETAAALFQERQLMHAKIADVAVDAARTARLEAEKAARTANNLRSLVGA